MFKNTASQSVTLYAVDSATGLPKTGDSANMVFYVSKDDGAVTAIASASGVPTESDATNAKGDYKIALSQAETNADKLRFSGKSTTANVVVVPQTIYSVPSGFTALTTAAIATGVWQDTTAGDFTTASSIGKSLYTSGVVPGGTGGLFIAGTNAATSITTALTANITGNLSGSVGSVTGLTASNLDATVSSRMASYTQPTGFLAATFPGGTVANTTNITAGTITTATNLTNAPTVGDFTAAMKTSLNAATPAVTVSDKTGFSLSSAGIQAIWDALTSALTTVGSIGKLLVTNIDATISSRLATSGYTAPDNTSITAIKTQTDKMAFTVANQIDANVITKTGFALTSAYDFAKGTVAMTESYATLGATMTPAQALYGINQQLGEQSISGTTMTVKKRDQSTTAKTYTLNDATSPTAITEAS